MPTRFQPGPGELELRWEAAALLQEVHHLQRRHPHLQRLDSRRRTLHMHVSRASQRKTLRPDACHLQPAGEINSRRD